MVMRFESIFKIFANKILRYDHHSFHCHTTQQMAANQSTAMLSCVLLAENSREPALWRHDLDVNDQNLLSLSIFQKIRHIYERTWDLKTQC